MPAFSTVCSGGSSASNRLTIKAWKNPAGRSASGVTVPDVTRLSRKVCAFWRRGERDGLRQSEGERETIPNKEVGCSTVYTHVGGNAKANANWNAWRFDLVLGAADEELISDQAKENISTSIVLC